MGRLFPLCSKILWKIKGRKGSGILVFSSDPRLSNHIQTGNSPAMPFLAWCLWPGLCSPGRLSFFTCHYLHHQHPHQLHFGTLFIKYLDQFARASITKYHEPGGWHNRNLSLSHIPKSKVSEGLTPSEGCDRGSVSDLSPWPADCHLLPMTLHLASALYLTLC